MQVLVGFGRSCVPPPLVLFLFRAFPSFLPVRVMRSAAAGMLEQSRRACLCAWCACSRSCTHNLCGDSSVEMSGLVPPMTARACRPERWRGRRAGPEPDRRLLGMVRERREAVPPHRHGQHVVGATPSPACPPTSHAADTAQQKCGRLVGLRWSGTYSIKLCRRAWGQCTAWGSPTAVRVEGGRVSRLPRLAAPLPRPIRAAAERGRYAMREAL